MDAVRAQDADGRVTFHSTVPSMLLELGYLSNKTEDTRLNTPSYQDKLVKGMVSGICEYAGRPLPVYDTAE